MNGRKQQNINTIGPKTGFYLSSSTTASNELFSSEKRLTFSMESTFEAKFRLKFEKGV